MGPKAGGVLSRPVALPLWMRLAALNVLAIAVAMCIFGALIYAAEGRSLLEGIDDSLRTQARNLNSLYQVRASLGPRARERVIPQPSVFSSPTFHVQVISPDGEILERSGSLGNRRLPIQPETLRRVGEVDNVIETVRLDGQDVRMYTAALVTDEQFLGYAQVARSLELVDDALESLARILVVGTVVLLLVTIMLVWLVAGISLRPIGRVTQAARDIGLSGRLDKRLTASTSRDEVGRLVETFNHMIDRLEAAFNAQRRFAADASHELRTPLTTIRGNLELLQRSGAVQHPDLQEALADVIEESQRMSRLVDGLLALARADAGQQQLARETVRLDELVHAVYREKQALALPVVLRLGQVMPIAVCGDADALKQLLLILVDNGVKYTPPGGVVELSLQAVNGQAALAVRDTGSGIEPADLERIFERFYRATSARWAGGAGLGLAIAKWIAAEHDAVVHVASTPGVGSTFTVTMAVAQPEARPAVDEPRPAWQAV